MKHPFWDRILMLICALCSLCAAAALVMLFLGKVSVSQATELLAKVDLTKNIVRVAVVAAAVVFGLFGLLLLSAMIPSRKKRSSNFAIQHNENGMVRISLKALEALVSRCLNQHAELKVVTSSLYSDEETIRVDVHIALQQDISMPLAVSALQKQIKRYIEACSGVQVQEVRVFVDSTMPATEETAKSPYVIPETLLGSLAEGSQEKLEPAEKTAEPEKTEPEKAEAEKAEPEKAESEKAEPEKAEPAEAEKPAEEPAAEETSAEQAEPETESEEAERQ